MPFETIEFSFHKNDFEPENWCVYVSDCGNIRIETRHFRQNFTPAEFVTLLRDRIEEQQIEK